MPAPRDLPGARARLGATEVGRDEEIILSPLSGRKRNPQSLDVRDLRPGDPAAREGLRPGRGPERLVFRPLSEELHGWGSIVRSRPARPGPPDLRGGPLVTVRRRRAYRSTRTRPAGFRACRGRTAYRGRSARLSAPRSDSTPPPSTIVYALGRPGGRGELEGGGAAHGRARGGPHAPRSPAVVAAGWRP